MGPPQAPPESGRYPDVDVSDLSTIAATPSRLDHGGESTVQRLLSELEREHAARELRAQVDRLAAVTSAEYSRSGVAEVIASGASAIFAAGWAMVAFVGDDDMVTLVHGPGVPDEIQRDWAEVPLETSVPVCDLLRGDAEAIELTSTADFGRWPHMVAEQDRAMMQSFVAVPVGPEGGPWAAVAIAWPVPHTLDGLERELLARLVERAEPAFRRAVQGEVDRDASTALVEAFDSVLTTHLPWLDVTSLYEQGDDVRRMGGDWFDLIELDDDRIAFVIGDVIGHDVRAAVEMTQVRHVLASHVMTDGSPCDAVTRTDRYLAARAPNLLATALVGVLERSGRLTLCSAGHLPPIAVDADHRTRALPHGLGSPLGAGLGGHADETCVLAPGSALVAYTDGVIEERDEAIDVSIARLAELLADADDRADDPSDAISRQLDLAIRRDSRNDDAAALVIHLRHPSSPQEADHHA